MEILITGSSGFLGTIIENYLSKNNNTYGLNRGSGFYQCDLEKKKPKFNSKFDLVIHAAGKAHITPKTTAEINEFYNVNVLGTQNLLKGLEASALPKSFVFISSVSVYGVSNGTLITEESPLKASDPYGLSKIEAELLVKDWCKNNNVICAILRLPLLVGENAPGNLGAMVKSIKNGYYFNIGGGMARKSMVLASDVAQLIPKVSKLGGVFNLTDGVHPNFNELSRAISFSMNKGELKNLPQLVAEIIAKFGDLIGSNAPINSLKLSKILSDLTFDDTKAKKILNWVPRSVVNYIRENKI